MPELPEVETVRRALAPVLEQRYIAAAFVGRDDLRWPLPLYTIKRDGRYKYRQYAMGNLLREGVDFGETFASTVSGDGLRWFCSLACASGMEIRGWDAATGYLQTEQRIPVYSYLPSHHGYSDMS